MANAFSTKLAFDTTKYSNTAGSGGKTKDRQPPGARVLELVCRRARTGRGGTRRANGRDHCAFY